MRDKNQKLKMAEWKLLLGKKHRFYSDPEFASILELLENALKEENPDEEKVDKLVEQFDDVSNRIYYQSKFR